jgi:hypothetical protein
MTKSKIKKKAQLGEDPGSASAKLKKVILFHYVKLAGHNTCYQCKKEITDVKEFSVDHKIPWLDSENPIELFNDITNIAFSHLKCNVKAARKTYCEHGATRKYDQGCRCDLCTKANLDKVRLYRSRKK